VTYFLKAIEVSVNEPRYATFQKCALFCCHSVGNVDQFMLGTADRLLSYGTELPCEAFNERNTFLTRNVAVAQEEEQLPINWKVGGSTPASPGYMLKCPWARH